MREVSGRHLNKLLIKFLPCNHENKKKLLTAIGPVTVAGLLVILILVFPKAWFERPSDKTIHKAASSMSVNVLKGNLIKNTAVEENKYLPFFGSSELSRVDTFHPSVLAEKYERPYEPFLLGAPGTQSLTHLLMLNSMKDSLKDKKIVFIISPQWFVKEGVSSQMFSFFYSPLQTYQWLGGIDEPSEADQYLAKRLLSFENVSSDTELKRLLQKIESKQKLSESDLKGAYLRYQLLENEDKLFSRMVVKSREKKIDNQMKNLPNRYDFDELNTLANKIGEKKTDNNEFKVNNGFYNKRILPMKDQLKNSQINFNYVSSPEFADFQLILNVLADNNIDCLFVIPPVNELWSDYTGISEEMLNTFSKKINEQLKDQGFNQIADFTYDRDVPYFMQDTIHIGWVGWLDLDQNLQKFLKDSNKREYDLKTKKYLSEEWMKEYSE